MRVFQLLPVFSNGDAIGHVVQAMRTILLQQGFETAVYANVIAPNLPAGIAEGAADMPTPSPDDIAIYHFSIGTEMSELVMALPCRKVLVYHNVTPCEYFKGYNDHLYEMAALGRTQLAAMKNTYDACFADSEYNKQELVALGYTCPIDVLPIIIPFEDYAQTPDLAVVDRYSDAVTNFMFLGRVSPNKKQEDVIAAFHQYQLRHNAKSRLFLVGTWGGFEKYKQKLDGYIKQLGVQNVIFTGHVSFQEILAYYTISDIFLCMSAHEGFCVPLIEAMVFDMPVVAYKAAAVPATLAGVGVLLETNQPTEVAQALHELIRDPLKRRQICAAQAKRLEALSYENLRALFLQYLAPLTGQ